MFAIITLSPDLKNMSVTRLVIGDFVSCAGLTFVSSQPFSQVSRDRKCDVLVLDELLCILSVRNNEQNRSIRFFFFTKV